MNARIDRQRPPEPGPGLPAMLYVLAAFALFCPPALPVWLAGAAVVRLTRVRLWHLAVAALVLGAGVVLIEGGPTPLPVIDSIEADSNLSPRQKQVLLDLYRTLISSVSIEDPDK